MLEHILYVNVKVSLLLIVSLMHPRYHQIQEIIAKHPLLLFIEPVLIPKNQ